MKSVERHKLETNALAHGLEVYIERYRPYISKVAAGIAAAIALLFLWSFMSNSSASRRNEAWDSFNEAVISAPVNMDQLRQTAQEFPNTKMQQMADVTWADGQVFAASNNYIYNRAAANEALNKATSAYQGVLKSSDDPQLVARAHLGLARVYEMQAELEKARAEYQQVTGAYANYAKAQAERLAKPEAKETYDWLASAKPPRPVAPLGPGTPGQTPEFTEGDLALPPVGATTTPGDAKSATETFDALLKEMSKDSPPDNRYKADELPAADEQPPVGLTAPGDAKSESSPSPPAQAAPPAEEESSKQ